METQGHNPTRHKMKTKNLTVALLPNSRAMMNLLIAQPGFLAIANNDSDLECVAMFPPASTKEEYDNNLYTARLMAAAPQLLRALNRLVAHPEDEEVALSLPYLLEYIDGKLGNQKDGGLVDLPKIF